MAKLLTEDKVLALIKKSSPRPVSLTFVCRRLGVPGRDRKSVRKMITRLVTAGSIEKGSDGKYRLPVQSQSIVGKMHGKQQGFAFVEPDDGSSEDVYVREMNQAGAMHGDRVETTIIALKSGGRREGRVTAVLERAHVSLIGYYEQIGKSARVVPAENKIRQEFGIPPKKRGGAHDGDVVLFRITEYPAEDRSPRGEVVEVLGKPDQDDMEIRIIIHKHGIPDRFPPPVLEEASAAPDRVSEEQTRGRKDLRDQTIFTIDGEQARDFDDAVSLERLGNGNLLLGVHIADVGSYVTIGSALDKEARERGTSVYFPDRAIPMLPPQLSNNICSLKPDQDRLTLSAIMELSADGEVLSHRIVESVIRSKARLTYTIARKLISGNTEGDAEEFAHLQGNLNEMADLAGALRRKRMAAGSMDFDLPEPEVLFDREGRVRGIVRAERNVAHKLIEEFMLLANKTVAQDISSRGVPLIYRTHEKPDPEKLKDFAEFAENAGFDTKGVRKADPKALQRVINEAEQRPEGIIISTLMLRAMMRAEYSLKEIGHFALAFHHYTHFTSPIRRYPDLVVHRILKSILKGAGDRPPADLQETARHCSAKEQASVMAEREVLKLLNAQLMTDYIGELFEGAIVGANSAGLFIELKEHFVEGFIHVTELKDDYYSFDRASHSLVGERKGYVYSIGDKVHIRVAGISLQQRHIDFSLA